MTLPRRPPALALPCAALAAAALALASTPAQAGAAVCARASAAPAHVSRHALVHSTLCLINAERRARGLRRLKLSRRLSRAARRHSRDMVHRRYFSHWSLSGRTFVDRIRRTGYLRLARRWFVGENIAWGSGNRAPVRAIVAAWMHSPGHRANILNRSFRQIGIGVALGAPSGMTPAATYTTDFGLTS